NTNAPHRTKRTSGRQGPAQGHWLAPPNAAAELPGPPARTSTRGKPGWRPRSASAVGSAAPPRSLTNQPRHIAQVHRILGAAAREGNLLAVLGTTGFTLLFLALPRSSGLLV